ncbi:MAG: FAD-dependent oxidoreductase, partial [Myxococcales bacterium]|nr:FAD-dependent oxidoreductase [Myxococcales bacterium]
MNTPSEAGLVAPGTLDRVDFHVFVLRADRPRLQATVRRVLEAPTGGAVRAEPIGARVLLAWTEVDRLVSADPRQGTIQYRDIAAWVPVRVVGPDGRARVVAWPAYIFVDHPHTMVTGRETFGLAKELGWFDMTEETGKPWTTDVWGSQGPGTALARRRLLEVLRPERASPVDERVSTPSWLRRALLSPLTWRRVDVIGLSQLRHPARPTEAIHQAIITAPISLRSVHGVRRVPGPHTLRVHALASHPLGATLGLHPGDHAIELAFHVRADVGMDVGEVLWQAPPASRPRPRPRRRRVAIVGGGVAGLATALALSEPGVRDAWEVTVYQRGWRLGGKGASGRNTDEHMRIEEHGLHVWYGFYENAFALLRRVYAELDRAPDAPLATLEQAFHKQTYVVLCEQLRDRWARLRVDFHDNGRTPGVGPITPPLPQLAGAVIGWIGDAVATMAREGLLDREPDPLRPRALARLARRLLRAPSPRLTAIAGVPTAAILGVVVELITRAPGRRDPLRAHRFAAALLDRYRRLLWPRVEPHLERDAVRTAWVLLDQTTTILRGLLADDVLERGLSALDDEDLRAWLRRHGAREVTVVGAPTVRFLYNAGFSFQGGDPARPDFAAGAALRGLLRLLFTYKGGVVYKMNGGMGDVVFAPIYELLRRRGVRIELFHSVDDVALSADGRRVDRLDVTAQAKVRDGDYAPLIDVDGLPCWPHEPRWEQLVDGGRLRDELRARGLNLEQVSAPPFAWPHARSLQLRRGHDFDDVVLALPPDALRSMAGLPPRVRGALEHARTVATQSYQLWLTATLPELGWREPAPILGTFVDPVDTWSDMTHLLAYERQPADVRGVSYFCGVLEDAPGETVAQSHARARARGIAYVQEDLPALWPKLLTDDGRLDGSLLADARGRAGAARLDAQYFRANAHGGERYVQSISGTIRRRLKTDETGVDNLLLAGDWIDNGFNCGCIEAAVISGLQCARSIAGLDLEIPGETDAWLHQLFGRPFTRESPYRARPR